MQNFTQAAGQRYRCWFANLQRLVLRGNACWNTQPDSSSYMRLVTSGDSITFGKSRLSGLVDASDLSECMSALVIRLLNMMSQFFFCRERLLGYVGVPDVGGMAQVRPHILVPCNRCKESAADCFGSCGCACCLT